MAERFERADDFIEPLPGHWGDLSIDTGRETIRTGQQVWIEDGETLTDALAKRGTIHVTDS